MVLYVIQFQFTPGFRTKDIDRDLEILLVTLDIGHGTGINIDLHALEQQLQGVILDELDHDIDRLGPEPGTNRFIIKYRVDHHGIFSGRVENNTGESKAAGIE
jgi:hypothetical protein